MIVAHNSLLSVLGHKETRFISYLTPLFNLFSAKAVVILFRWQSKGTRLLGRTFVVLTLIATALVTTVSIRASVGNYPGGEAMQKLHVFTQQSDGESLRKGSI